MTYVPASGTILGNCQQFQTVLHSERRVKRTRQAVCNANKIPHRKRTEMAYIGQYRDGWRAQIQKDGVRVTKTFPTKREAAAWATEQEAKKTLLSGKSFDAAVDRYIREVSPKKDGEKWEKRRLHAMLEYFGGMSLDEIQAPQIAQWRDLRLKTVSGSTVVRDVNLLRNLFSVARLEWKWIDHKPFEGVKLPKQNAPRHQIWPWQLIKRVLRAERTGKTKEMQDAFHIALRTGMRLGEVLAAPSHFDARRRVVRLVDVAGARKTDRIAEIPIGRIAARLLQRPPFQVDANEGSVLFGKLCRELLIEDLHFHDSRGTALTHLAKKVDVLTLSRISRHKDLKILMNVYYRVTTEQVAKMI